MKTKMVSFFIATIMIASIFGIIPQNVGEQGPDPISTDIFINSSPQDVEIPNLNSNEILDLTELPLQNIEVASLSMNGSGGLADSPWPMFRQNLNHTGLSPYDTSGNNGQLKWSFKTDSYIFSSPTIGSDWTIFVGSFDNYLYAIYPNGTLKWNFKTGSYIYSSPAIGIDGTVYIGSDDYKLYAINPDGTQKWNFTTEDIVQSSPTIDSDGTIYFGSNDFKFYAINPDGSEKWNFPTEFWVGSSAAIDTNGTIYIGSWDSNLYAINPNGTQKWKFTSGGSISSSPVISHDGTIFIGSNDNRLYAIDPNGIEKWNFKTGKWVFSSPAIGSDGTIYVGSQDHKLYAINPNGTEKWNFTAIWEIDSSPAIGSDGTIYVGSRDSNLYAINPNGTQRWVFTAENMIYSSPSVGFGGTIYVGSHDNKLYAIGTPNIPPISNAGADQTMNEGDTILFDASSSYDSDGTIETYEWDFDSNDGLWWETGAAPDVTGPIPTHIYGDDGIYVATLRVIDNDNLSATDTCNITVHNVDPTVSIESATMEVEIGLRVAGRKYNNVSMTLYEKGNSMGYVSIERLPGSPNAQTAWIPVTLNMTKTYSAIVTFTPEDPSNIGANPVWIYIKSENGSIKKIHHTFNVQQSKKRDSDHWNHIEPWDVDLSNLLIGLPLEITSYITDPGSDDETLTYSYAAQTVTVTYLNNPPNLDPYPSPEINPRDIMDTTTLIYEGLGTITLIVKDDDNIRLGGGLGTDFINIS